MSEFTHARCGGVLVEIVRPDWWAQASRSQHWQNAAVARCRRCGLEGEVTLPGESRGPERNDPPVVVGGSLQVSP